MLGRNANRPTSWPGRANRGSSLDTARAASESNIISTDAPSDTQALNVVDQEDVPPNGGYGWVCTACLFLINAHTWGVNAAWAVFLARYLAQSTYPGASQLEYALIGGLSISQALFVAPVVAIAVRRIGTRMTLGIGAVLVFVAFLGASFATEIWHLFLTQGACFGYGMGFLYIPATAVLPQWFSTRRSLALGIASSGAGLGGLVYSLVAGKFIETVGLQWTYRILAICTLVANMTSAFFLRDRNRSVKPDQTSFDMRVYKTPETILIVIWGFATELAYIVLLYSLPNFAITIGLTSAQGSVVGASLNLGLGIGRPVIGYYSDAFGRINMATVVTAACGVFCLALWIPARSFGLLILFALLAGTCCGVFWASCASVMAEVVGLKRLPIAFGMTMIVMVLPTTFAEAIGLQIMSHSGYVNTQIFVGVMYLVGAASTWVLRSWKLAEIEKKAFVERCDGDELAANQTFGRNWVTARRLFKVARV